MGNYDYSCECHCGCDPGYDWEPVIEEQNVGGEGEGCRCRCRCMCPRPARPVTRQSMFAANRGGRTITVDQDGTLVPLPNLQNLDGFKANTGNTEFAVPATGRYYITYQIHLTAAVGLRSRVLINGAPNPASVRRSALESSYSASFIVNLVAGDQLALQLDGVVGPVTLDNGVGASLTIIRLA